MSYKILAINPGSTSTKIGVYVDDEEVWVVNLAHSATELAKFPSVIAQFDYRLQTVKSLLAEKKTDIRKFQAVVARGGMLKPVIGGTYGVNATMLADLKSGQYGVHASSLGAMLADSLAGEAGIPAYIVDPVVVDELAPIARYTGRPEIMKRSVFHALNQKAIAKRFAKSIHRKYEELNLIIVHMGGGISVGCHKGGKVVEVTNALDGEGPFSPERAGALPAWQFAEMILTQGLGKEEVRKLVAGKGGIVAHLGTNDVREVEKRIAAGDEKAKAVYEAMIYQVARSIAGAAVPVYGKVDYIILTGGIAYSKELTAKLTEYVKFIAPVIVIPGEDELKALSEGALRVLTGEEKARKYF